MKTSPRVAVNADFLAKDAELGDLDVRLPIRPVCPQEPELNGAVRIELDLLIELEVNGSVNGNSAGAVQRLKSLHLRRNSVGQRHEELVVRKATVWQQCQRIPYSIVGDDQIAISRLVVRQAVDVDVKHVSLDVELAVLQFKGRWPVSRPLRAALHHDAGSNAYVEELDGPVEGDVDVPTNFCLAHDRKVLRLPAHDLREAAEVLSGAGNTRSAHRRAQEAATRRHVPVTSSSCQNAGTGCRFHLAGLFGRDDTMVLVWTVLARHARAWAVDALRNPSGAYRVLAAVQCRANAWVASSRVAVPDFVKVEFAFKVRLPGDAVGTQTLRLLRGEDVNAPTVVPVLDHLTLVAGQVLKAQGPRRHVQELRRRMSAQLVFEERPHRRSRELIEGRVFWPETHHSEPIDAIFPSLDGREQLPSVVHA
mmetsp:Transcript_43853/g.102429  ORF Transcript_43853/g.102429 Transcript_43853/m.102429 type:complete len:422 (+) Transcript_43853:1120-2385(+)